MMFREKKQFNYAKEINAIADGHKKSLQRLYEQEAAYMYSFAYKVLKQYSLAEEVLVDVFTIFWHNATYVDEQHARGWLYTIFRYHLLSIAQKNSSLFKENNSALTEVCTNLHAGVHHYLETGDFYQVFEELPEETQRIFITTYFSQGTHADVAALLQIPLAVLKKNIALGLQHIINKRQALHIKHAHSALIGEFILGGMNDSESQQLSQLLNNDALAKTVSLIWEEEFLHFLKQLVMQTPPSTLWLQIKANILPENPEKEELEEVLNLSKTTNTPSYIQHVKKWWISRFFWRSCSAVLLLLLVLALFTNPFHTPIQLIAVMSSPSDNHHVAFTVIQTDKLTIRPVLRQNTSNTLKLQLWQKNQQGEIQAITVLNQHKATRYHLTSPLSQGDVLFISIEPNDAHAGKKTTGQILYQGVLVKP